MFPPGRAPIAGAKEGRQLLCIVTDRTSDRVPLPKPSRAMSRNLSAVATVKEAGKADVPIIPPRLQEVERPNQMITK
jgi:hypothetical protein